MAPYHATSKARLFRHIVVVAILGATVAASVAVAPAIPGNASVPPSLDGAPNATAGGITARFTQSTDQREVLGTQIEQTAGSAGSMNEPATDMLLAVLALESSTTPVQAAESMERIVSLGLPQPAPPAATLIETELPPAEPEQSLGDPPVGADHPDCRETSNPAYCVYTVVEGDTLGGIAQRAGFAGNGALSAADMLAESNRPDVTSSDHIEPGQNIRVPAEPGILHTVLFAETAAELSLQYGVSLDAILTSSYNSLGADGILYIGQDVFIPSPTQLPVNEEAQVIFDEPTPGPVVEPTLEAVVESEATEGPQEPSATPQPTLPPIIRPLAPIETATPTPEPEEPTATAAPVDEATAVPTASRIADESPTSNGSTLFIWPVHGPLSSNFGPSHPLGIDIDLYGDPNAGIVAARGGTVAFAGGDPCCSYGYYVIVDHGTGVQTLYAHFSEIVVSEGQDVAQGELLGYGGHTGYATGDHLHFEMRVNGNVVNPLLYLP